MAEKGTKKKKAKADAGVLGALPSTRPNRLGRHAAKTTPKAKAKAKPVARKKKPVVAKAKAKAKAPVAKAVPITDATPRRPKPVRSASKNLAAPAKQAAAKRAPAPPAKQPSGTELVTTVVQAAGELAQVGLSIGGQIVKRAVERLPKP